ncbi:MAG: hypothetical protein IJI43_03700, partial [Bacilli bacterium]|nr:hypothetical protein [Bacilli bacterium]
DPDNKKLIHNLKNAIIALVIIFLIPTIISVTMMMLDEKIELSACWKAASNYKFSKGKYIPTSTKKPTKLFKNKKYEVGDPKDVDDNGNLKLTTTGVGNQREWINTLEATADKLIAMRAHYYGSARAHSLEAVKKTHDVNCASYISLAMQEFGLLPKGKVIYISVDGVIKGDGADYIKKSKKVTISYPDKKASQLNLKPGDILGFDKTKNPHTFAYAGKKNGKYLWYTAGPGDVSEKNYGPKTKRYNNKIIGVVIRPKYNSI